MNKPYDAIVVGSGPAGSTAACGLAQRGRRVIVLDRESFPRYAVGESMLPFCYFPLREIGMLDKMKSSTFVNKYSVQFVREDGRVSAPFYFVDHMQHEAGKTWQVERSEFDAMLLDHARESGAEVRTGVTVTDLLRDESGAVTGVRASDDEGDFELHAPITVDASGQHSFAATRLGWRIMDQNLKKVALWTYYEGAMRDPGRDAGATTVAYVGGKNWFWYIPLQNDRVSVGIVGARDYLYDGTRDRDEIFQREIVKNPWIREHLAPGKRVEDYFVTGDFSYRSKYCATDGLVLAGDAFSFLDPVFSSGLFLALQMGVMAAETIDQALTDNDVRAWRFCEYGKKSCNAIEAMRALVYAFYSPDFSFGSIIRKYPDLRADLTDCLIGDLQKDFDPLFSAIAEFADIPEKVPHGGPMCTAHCACAAV